jgi:hypothetical protein
VSDKPWEIVEPLLPEGPPKPGGGRPRVDDRAALTGVVLKSGIPWEILPKERWAADRVRPAGGVCATGRRRVCGRSYITCCWIVSGSRPGRLGEGVFGLSERAAKGGPINRSESDG